MIKDPFLWLENIEDQKVIEWTLERDRRTRDASRLLEQRVLKYYLIPKIVSIRNTKRGTFC